jgi:protocatechuate 4,5-dioxygenase, beta chain
MASIVSAFVLPHVPLTLSEPAAVRPDQSARVHDAYAKIARRLRELDVDTVITIGADHYGLFGPHCIPQCLIAIGDVEGPMEEWLGVERGAIPSNQPLAQHILRRGHTEGIDWSFAKSMLVDHATMVPYHFCIRPAQSIRTIPIYLNEAVRPFIPSSRAARIGQSIRDAVDSWSGKERVVVFGTGGISHWVGTAEMGKVNEAFDRRILRLAEAGDIEALTDISDDEILSSAGNGGVEIKSWICAMASVPRSRAHVIHYEPIPEWICGFGFAELEAAA